MSSIVLELQREALDQTVNVSQLLRKALIVARKLSLAEFQSWVERELNGYRDASDIPDYREAFGEVKAWNPYHGWMPVVFQDSKKAELLSRRKNGQSVAELEDLLTGKAESFHVPFPPEIRKHVCRGIGYQTEVSLFVPQSSIVRVLDSVRTIVLNWALKLEEDGILGENLSFTEREKRQATEHSFNVMNFYGPVHGPQIRQAEGAVQVAVTIEADIDAVGDFIDRLRKELPQIGLSGEKKQEAEAEIATVDAQVRSPRPKTAIIREGLESLGRILEGTAGSAGGQLVIELGKILGGS